MTASGKSTVVDLLAERLGLKVMPEEFRDQYDLLRRFHHERRWAFPMQLNFLVTRFAQYLCATEEESYVLDRSIFGDKIYATLYHRLGYFSDSQYGMYLTLYDNMIRHLVMPDLLVVLHCPFGEIMRRILLRGREDEIRAGEPYWRELYNAYSHFLEVVRSEVATPRVIELDLSDPAFIRSPDRIDAFLTDVRRMLDDADSGRKPT
jgi:deoxyadenosine/deoxycytidine kinase